MPKGLSAKIHPTVDKYDHLNPPQFAVRSSIKVCPHSVPIHKTTTSSQDRLLQEPIWPAGCQMAIAVIKDLTLEHSV